MSATSPFTSPPPPISPHFTDLPLPPHTTTSRELEISREAVRSMVRDVVKSMLNSSSSGTPSSKWMTSVAGGGVNSPSTGTGWITTDEEVDAMITEELFEGEGRVVGEAKYDNADDWRWEVSHERKRRSYPQTERWPVL